MIGLKDAIRIGKDFIYEVYDKNEGFLLEAASIAKDENIWYVSFSLPHKLVPVNQLQSALGLDRRVIYKTVKIDETGEVISMEMGVPNLESETGRTAEKQLEAA